MSVPSCGLAFCLSATILQAQCVGLVSRTNSALTIRNTRPDQTITAIAILEKTNDEGTYQAKVNTFDLLVNPDSLGKWTPATTRQFATTLSGPPSCAVMYENGVTDGAESLAHALSQLRRLEIQALPEIQHLVQRLDRNAATAQDYQSALLQYRDKNPAVPIPQFNSTGSTPFSTMRNDALQSGVSQSARSMLISRLLTNLNQDTSSDFAQHLLQTLQSIASELNKTSL